MENYIDEITGLLALELSNIDADHERLIELLEKSERTFRDEHLSRFDEGKPVHPDVQDLKRHMKAWIKMYPNNGYIENIWNGEEWNEYDQVTRLLKSWIRMIDDYYPAPQKEKTIVIEYTRNQAEEPQQAEFQEPQQVKESQEQGEREKTTPFLDLILSENKKEVLAKLHRVADGKKGKEFVLIMFAAKEKGWIILPKYGQAKAEFHNIGHESGYDKYIKLVRELGEHESKGEMEFVDKRLKDELENACEMLKC